MTPSGILERTSATVQIRGAWPAHLALLSFSMVIMLSLFARDIGAMVSIWWNASTYNHCLFIPAISGWLVMQRRDEVARFRPIAYWPGLLCLLVSMAIWTLGEAAGIALFRQAAIVLMIQSLVFTLLGPNVTRALLFPLFYLSFMVPVGEELVPALQTLTAEMSMFLLGIVGIPAHINGIFITIPNGYFKVAEACSGVKFLVAMAAYGTLVANVCFKSWYRRAAFLAMALAVPILANGVRAFGTIYASHLSTADAAAGFDHVVYGWVFFAFVMALVMAIGWRFFDRAVDDPWVNNFAPLATMANHRPVLTAGFALAAMIMPLIWLAAASASGNHPMNRAVALPDVAGWAPVASKGTPWAPRFDGADHLLVGHFADAANRHVDVALALFATQGEDRELVGFGQGAQGNGDTWSWSASARPPKNGKAERLVAPGPVNREVVSFYLVGGKLTGSSADVKFETMKTRLLGGDQAAGVILVSAVDDDGRPARKSIDAYLKSLGAPEKTVTAIIESARGR